MQEPSSVEKALPDDQDHKFAMEAAAPAASVAPAGTTKKVCNPCCCCMSCGVKLRWCLIPIIIFYVVWSLPLPLFAIVSNEHCPYNGTVCCKPVVPAGGGIVPVQNYSSCEAEGSREETVEKFCKPYDKCKSQVKGYHITAYLQFVCFIAGAVLLAVVMLLTRISILLFVSDALIILATILLLISIFLFTNATAWKLKASVGEEDNPLDNTTKKDDGTSPGTIGGIIVAAFTVPLVLYFCVCAIAFHYQITAGEYDSQTNQVIPSSGSQVSQAGANDMAARSEEAPPYSD